MDVDNDAPDVSRDDGPVVIEETREEKYRRERQEMIEELGLEEVVELPEDPVIIEAPRPRNRRLIVDKGELKLTTGEMQANIADYSDTLRRIELAPPNPRMKDLVQSNMELQSGFVTYPEESGVEEEELADKDDSTDEEDMTGDEDGSDEESDKVEAVVQKYRHYPKLPGMTLRDNFLNNPHFFRSFTQNNYASSTPSDADDSHEEEIKISLDQLRTEDSEESETSICGDAHLVSPIHTQGNEDLAEEYNTAGANEQEEDEDGQREMDEYETITEIEFDATIKAFRKEKTESVQCECHEKGRNCSSSACLNRASWMECPQTCKATNCQNQRFAEKFYAKTRVGFTDSFKGHGLFADEDIPTGTFIHEYVGRATNEAGVQQVKDRNAADKTRHRYLLKSKDYMIDATEKGNDSRFINHSCDPNAECQKWFVPGTPGCLDRMGFFATRLIKKDEEILFKYDFNNDDGNAQPCSCGSDKCTGFIGKPPKSLSEEQNAVTIGDGLTEGQIENRLKELEEMEPSQRTPLIQDTLDYLTINNKKHWQSIVQLGRLMADCKQVEMLLGDIFSGDTPPKTQKSYAANGIAKLMKKWLLVEVNSFSHLPLIFEILNYFDTKTEIIPKSEIDNSLVDAFRYWANVDGKEMMKQLVSDLSTSSIDGPGTGATNKVYESIEKKLEDVIAAAKKWHSLNCLKHFTIPKKVSVAPQLSESSRKRMSSSSPSANGMDHGPERKDRNNRRSRSRSPRGNRFRGRKQEDMCRRSDSSPKRSKSSRINSNRSHSRSPSRSSSSPKTPRSLSPFSLPANRNLSVSPIRSRSSSPFSEAAKQNELSQEQSYSQRRGGNVQYNAPNRRNRYQGPWSPNRRRRWSQARSRSPIRHRSPIHRRSRTPHQSPIRRPSPTRHRSPIRHQSRTRSPMRHREYNEERNNINLLLPGLQGMQELDSSKNEDFQKSTSNASKIAVEAMDENREAWLEQRSTSPPSPFPAPQGEYSRPLAPEIGTLKPTEARGVATQEKQRKTRTAAKKFGREQTKTYLRTLKMFVRSVVPTCLTTGGETQEKVDWLSKIMVNHVYDEERYKEYFTCKLTKNGQERIRKTIKTFITRKVSDGKLFEHFSPSTSG